VLMDLQMPHMDGYDTAQAIRKDHPRLPIVAMTAGIRADTADHVRRHGMDALVRKPIDPLVLVPLLNRLVGKD